MKWINNFEPLKVRGVETDNVRVTGYTKNSWIIEIDNKKFLMVKRTFSNQFQNNMQEKETINNIDFEIYTNKEIQDTNLYLNYGDNDSIIIDMNGIDNFRFAKSEIFNDYTIRKIAKK